MDNEKYTVDLLTADAVFRIADPEILEEANDILTYGAPDTNHLEIRRTASTIAIKNIDCAYCCDIAEGDHEIPVPAAPLKEVEHLEQVPFLEIRDEATGYCRDFSLVFNKSELIVAFGTTVGSDQAAYINRSGRLEFFINVYGSLLAIKITDLSETEYGALCQKRREGEARKSRLAAEEKKRKKREKRKKSMEDSVPPSITAPPKPSGKKLYQRGGFIVLVLLLFWPLGLFLMWKFADWSRTAKIIVTCLIAVSQIWYYTQVLSG